MAIHFKPFFSIKIKNPHRNARKENQLNYNILIAGLNLQVGYATDYILVKTLEKIKSFRNRVQQRKHPSITLQLWFRSSPGSCGIFRQVTSIILGKKLHFGFCPQNQNEPFFAVEQDASSPSKYFIIQS